MERRGVDGSQAGGELGAAAPTFGERVLEFYRTLPRPPIQSAPVEWIDPYDDPEAVRCTQAFYRAFYADQRPRLFLIGINPGRFGAGVSGVPFTDGHALEQACGIPNTLPRRQELSAAFIQRVAAEWGGAAAFFGSVYITGACPLGLTRAGKNFNYYDDRAVLAELEPFIVESMGRQVGFGALRNAAVVIGAGKNLEIVRRLNERHGWFGELHGLDHPRFIMQYRRKQVDDYVAAYLRTLRAAVGDGGAGAPDRTVRS